MFLILFARLAVDEKKPRTIKISAQGLIDVRCEIIANINHTNGVFIFYDLIFCGLIAEIIFSWFTDRRWRFLRLREASDKLTDFEK